MKFNCDSCGVAYMISDEKVGPSGVRVRCKKCGNQITVRRAETAGAPVLERSGPASGPGLDEELGSAFDQAFGEKPPATAQPAPEPATAVAPEATPAAPSAAAPAQEWYVAVGEAQVGPLPLVEVRKRWEGGEIGPDSLVWRTGMAEWGPLSGVSELAAYLAPVPQPSAPGVAPASSVFAAPADPAARQAATPPPAGPAPEVAWKPAGASALATLASEELASRTAAPVEKAAPRRSVMEQLPDSGGVDPTGMVPLPLKAMEQTGERQVHRSSVARGAQELRHRRAMRTVVLVALLVVVAAGGGAFTWIQYSTRPAAPPPPLAAAPASATSLPPAAAEPAAAALTGAAAPETPAQPASPAATNAVAEAPVPAAPPAAARPPVRVAEAPAPKKPRAPARPARPPAAQAAQAAPTSPADRPAPKKKDGVLDFDQGSDDDLAAALGSGAGGRKVYVPPAAGGAAAPPDRLSDAQILESVKLHTEDLRRCVTEQQAREPGLKGTIKVAWVIQPDGAPRDVRCLTPEFAQGEFARCMVKEIRGIRFARVGDPKGQTVTFPFTF